LTKPENCEDDDNDSYIVPTYAEIDEPAGESKIELTNSINYTQVMNDGSPSDIELPEDISPWMDNGGVVFKAPAFQQKCWNRTAGAVPVNCTSDCIDKYNLWGDSYTSFGELNCNGFYPTTNETYSTSKPPPGIVSVSVIFYFLFLHGKV